MKIELRPDITMFKTQVETLIHLCQSPRFLDFSEMGAGKSLPQAVLAKGLLDEGQIDYTIIVTPKAVVGDWFKIFRDFVACDLQKDVLVYYGVPTAMREYIKLRPIIITTYEVLAQDFGRFFELCKTFRVNLVLDEAHRLRTPGNKRVDRNGKVTWVGSRRTAMCTELAWQSHRAYLLTGSPIVNGIKNAFSYINMLWPGVYYNSYDHFKLQHFMYQNGQLVSYKNMNKVEEIIAQNSVRFLKREIMDLPPVTYMTRELEWDPAQKAMYKKMAKDFIIETPNSFLEAESVGARLTRLHQILTNPKQLGLECDSTRWSAIDDDLESIGIDEHKVVIFAHYRHTIDRLKKKFANLNPAVVYGGTGDVEAEKEKFNNDPTCRLFIAHPMSAGIGINLTVSSYIIFFEYSYDLDGYDQAVARVDRPGQKRAVTVINYGVRGSMELKRILPNLISKKKVSMMVLRDPEQFMKFISIDDEDYFAQAA